MGLHDWFRGIRLGRADPQLALPTPADLIAFWRSWIAGNWKAWVLFRHGTCVVLPEVAAEPRARAIELLKEWGPVEVGSPAGDFTVFHSRKHRGWVVTCHHPDIISYVGPEELPRQKRKDINVGLQGRAKRDRDAAELEVIHVELRS